MESIRKCVLSSDLAGDSFFGPNRPFSNKTSRQRRISFGGVAGVVGCAIARDDWDLLGVRAPHTRISEHARVDSTQRYWCGSDLDGHPPYGTLAASSRTSHRHVPRDVCDTNGYWTGSSRSISAARAVVANGPFHVSRYPACSLRQCVALAFPKSDGPSGNRRLGWRIGLPYYCAAPFGPRLAVPPAHPTRSIDDSGG